MFSTVSKNILSMTVKELSNRSLQDILIMLSDDLSRLDKFNAEYISSITLTIIRKVFSIKEVDNYNKFYRIITSKEFRKNKYVYQTLDDSNLKNLHKLLEIYDKNADLIDNVFMNNEKLFDEIIYDDYDVDSIFDGPIMRMFDLSSYKVLLSYLTRDNERRRVVKSLLKSKNHKFILVVAQMDEEVRRHSKNDQNYFDAILSAFNHNGYRRLLWDYYNRYVRDQNGEVSTDVIKRLLNYTFIIAEKKYVLDSVLDIVTDIPSLNEYFQEEKNTLHTLMFGYSGYQKFKSNKFDPTKDFTKIDNDNQLLNLKIAFFGIIYGVTYLQAERIVNREEIFKTDKKGDKLINDTILAMKTLYNLRIDNVKEINLYRDVYYQYVKKNGIYASVEIPALLVMEGIIRRVHDEDIEII